MITDVNQHYAPPCLVETPVTAARRMLSGLPARLEEIQR
jgi:hypothetical protein